VAKNVLGSELVPCGLDPITGFYRTGCCETDAQDLGVHVVCAKVTLEFLQFSKWTGNDLMTPRPEYQFAGLKPGDTWCLCVERWKDALEAGVAPPIVLEASHEKALEYVSLDVLKNHAEAERANHL